MRKVFIYKIRAEKNPNHAVRLDPNVVLIHDGKIKDIGPAFELITIDKLKSIYGDSVCYSEDQNYKEISFK